MSMNYVPRIKKKYLEEVIPALQKELQIKNVMAVPKLLKICINQGVGSISSDKKLFECALNSLSLISGQKSIARKSKKSISNFKLREGANVGCMVTLRGDKMYEFFDRLVTIGLPRVRDFRGVKRDGFDNSGIYNLGIRDILIFPEIKGDMVLGKNFGMNITFVTNAKNDKDAFCLLKLLGMPFREL